MVVVVSVTKPVSEASTHRASALSRMAAGACDAKLRTLVRYSEAGDERGNLDIDARGG